jgi:transcriptional regulator with XRE-family HTH domain
MAPRAVESLRIPEQFWLREDARNALRTRDIGALFRLLRQWTGASQTQLGHAIGVEQGYVSRIMNGRRAVVTIELLERIANGCNMPDETRILLGLAPRYGSWLRHRPPEKGFAQPISLLFDGAALTVEVECPTSLSGVAILESNPGETDHSETRPRRIGAGDVDLLVSARDRYEHMYRAVGGLPSQVRLTQFLNELALPMLRADYDSAIGRQLFRAVGSLVALSGVCAYDAGRQLIAKRHFLNALRLAKLAGDPVFDGHVVSLLANQALRTGQPQEAVKYAEAGTESRQ